MKELSIEEKAKMKGSELHRKYYLHSEYSEESLLDAAFEMICWLKENGKI